MNRAMFQLLFSLSDSRKYKENFLILTGFYQVWSSNDETILNKAVFVSRADAKSGLGKIIFLTGAQINEKSWSRFLKSLFGL